MSLETSETRDPTPDEVQAARAKADAKRCASESPHLSGISAGFGALSRLPTTDPPLSHVSPAADAVAARLQAAKSNPPSVSHSWDARDALDACERLFRDHPGHLIRACCRQEIFNPSKDEPVRDLVYGEFGFMSLVAFFRKYANQIPPNAVLADLGSGVGRPLFAAACLAPTTLAKCVGVEKLGGLHALACELKALYDTELAPALGVDPPVVEVHRGDFLHGTQWRGADVVLINSAIFRDELFEATELRASELLGPGALVVTLRVGFRDVGRDDACWELLEATERRQSWGVSTVFVHRRTSASHRRAGIED